MRMGIITAVAATGILIIAIANAHAEECVCITDFCLMIQEQTGLDVCDKEPQQPKTDDETGNPTTTEGTE